MFDDFVSAVGFAEFVPGGSGGGHAEFVATWRTFHDIQRRQPGFLSNRMHHAADHDTKFRFVNVSQWESMQHYRAALAATSFTREAHPQ